MYNLIITICVSIVGLVFAGYSTAKAERLDMNGHEMVVFLHTQSTVTQTDELASGKKERSVRKNSQKSAVIIKVAKGNIYIINPDAKERIFYVDGKLINATGVVAGYRSNTCSQIAIEGGVNEKYCGKYSHRNGNISIDITENYLGERGKGKEKYKIKYDGKSCKLLSYSSKGAKRNVYMPILPDLINTELKWSVKLTKASCKVKKGSYL